MNSVPLPEFSEESQEQRQFAFQLLRLIKNEKTYQLSYNPEEVVNTLGGLKKELAKTAFEYEKLNEHNRKKIDEITQSKSKAKTFLQLLQNENNSLIMEPIPKVENESKISTGWMGKRLTIEIPVLGEKGLQKHLAPELLNQDFMWSSDYYHYEDWKTILKHYYDNLSLLIVEPNHNFVYSEMRLPEAYFLIQKGIELQIGCLLLIIIKKSLWIWKKTQVNILLEKNYGRKSGKRQFLQMLE